ncbi:MAG TPA: ElyC/SanA/YdcF family protein [Cyclobacteriaceae bacterium]|nr:ElyC/SanA/YdcF family protein [Cyclobacteriaceae bacterium]HMV89564.1 ElyC/SanA/YdcF family protein [Cyclobacteriaceae bacterium]HMX00459.1 ElyC/SanA/YdcF family protein [Cyclobacteriaceae bacterium]HMX50457.1 ElyC/SanA/YdcF family protein [Cyclobacteriaceae bacterium]HMY93279.1 ElyC/SanA/YdcF family protein [Cyclobacteriaceae bacterium]
MKSRKHLWKWLKRLAISGVIAVILLFYLSNVWVVNSTKSYVYTDYNKLPNHRVALVLGTSNKTISGQPNDFFVKRMETAAELYKLGKIDHFILSGHNPSQFYNEPMEMKKALMIRGVPSEAITLDYAGLRTLDSVIRSKEIFGQDKIIIITQPFHSYRALFISHYYDIEAVAMVTEGPAYESSFKVRVREYFARTKAVLDLYVFKTSPRFLGKKENLKGK